MATKGFKKSAGAEAATKKINNPAEMFISQSEEIRTEEKTEAASENKRGRKPRPQEPPKRKGRPPRTEAPKTDPKQEQEQEQVSTPTGRTVTVTLKEGQTLDHAVVEAKKSRVQFVFRPSLLERFKKYCEDHNVSMNEMIHIILEREIP